MPPLKVSREGRILDYLVSVAHLDAARDAAKSFGIVRMQPKGMPDRQRRNHGQAFDLTKLMADPQRVQTMQQFPSFGVIVGGLEGLRDVGELEGLRGLKPPFLDLHSVFAFVSSPA